MRILMIDNYDSFTYNLVQYLGELGAEVTVKRNDVIDVAGVRALNPDAIVISPGPCTPKRRASRSRYSRSWPAKLPILGVCLGEQCMGEAFGGQVVRAPRLMHGKTSPVIPRRPHALRGAAESVRGDALSFADRGARTRCPNCLEVSARTAEGEVMGLRHSKLAVEGVQFHPESIGTAEGKHLLRNFLKRAAA